jgi:hypothetical protein
MISVHANVAEEPVIREFFELFKTPWRFYRPGVAVDILLCTRQEIPATDAKLVLVFNSELTAIDASSVGVTKVTTTSFKQGNWSFPIYGAHLVKLGGEEILWEQCQTKGQTLVRIGYDLFAEIRHLLTAGQPADNAAVPTLEIHIAWLREMILSHGLPLVEIPPRPVDHEFTVCLTHDVDHVGVRHHRFDHTLLGFLYRATLGSVREVFAGKKTFGQLAQNGWAVLKLPFIHLGLAQDFWYQFDHYVALENGAPSTFYIIPKKGVAGQDPQGNCQAKRAASYDATELKDILRDLATKEKEIGTHGLEAWREASAGISEREIISRLTGQEERGVRMHWLYFGKQSHAELERAGFVYDSTVGYNETVGYRAGATQVYQPLTTKTLLELPLHVMDTALFYPSYLNLSPKQAEQTIHQMLADFGRYGGVCTVNWHDRSIAPERLWDGTYRWMLKEFAQRGAWFATAAQSVAWFQKRRAVTFEIAPDGQLKIKSAPSADQLPELRVRVYPPNSRGEIFTEQTLATGEELSLAA